MSRIIIAKIISLCYTNFMNGIIVVNAYIQKQSELNQALRVQEELDNLNIQTKIVYTNEIAVFISNGHFNCNFKDIVFCIYLDKDKHILHMLEKLNIKIFNNSTAIEICDDKLLTHIALAQNNIPMPKTIGGVLCYYPQAKVKENILQLADKELGYPMIIKECYGSLGKGIYLVNNKQELYEIAEKVKLKPHLYQQFIKESSGKDIRVIVIGGKCVGGMLRQNSTDFRSNIEVGGKGYPTTLTQEQIDLCEIVSKILNLDYCGIDLLIDKDGKPLVCEVNSNAFFRTFEQITNINVAKIYANHIKNSLEK